MSGDEDYVPDLKHIQERMPARRDKAAYLTHALRFFEEALMYAQCLEDEKWQRRREL